MDAGERACVRRMARLWHAVRRAKRAKDTALALDGVAQLLREHGNNGVVVNTALTRLTRLLQHPDGAVRAHVLATLAATSHLLALVRSKPLVLGTLHELLAAPDPLLGVRAVSALAPIASHDERVRRRVLRLAADGGGGGGSDNNHNHSDQAGAEMRVAAVTALHGLASHSHTLASSSLPILVRWLQSGERSLVLRCSLVRAITAAMHTPALALHTHHTLCELLRASQEHGQEAQGEGQGEAQGEREEQGGQEGKRKEGDGAAVAVVANDKAQCGAVANGDSVAAYQLELIRAVTKLALDALIVVDGTCEAVVALLSRATPTTPCDTVGACCASVCELAPHLASLPDATHEQLATALAHAVNQRPPFHGALNGLVAAVERTTFVFFAARPGLCSVPQWLHGQRESLALAAESHAPAAVREAARAALDKLVVCCQRVTQQ